MVSNMSKTVVKAANITKIYHLYNKKSDRIKEALFKAGKHTDFYALNNISFKVDQGENVAFIGKNGSGKSTLLKILTGVLTPSSGSYSIDGRVSALLELGAGFNPEYTGIENVYLNGALLGFSKAEMDTKLDDILSLADIGNFIGQPVKTYSSGMYVRLAFAVAINVNPDILIVDEALSVGDIFFQQKCYKKFEDFRERGKTILFVTHDLNSVVKYCNRAYLLNDGQIIDEGIPHDIVDSYKKLMSGIDLDANLAVSEYNETNEKVNGIQVWKSLYDINPGVLSYGGLELEIIDFGIFDDKDKLVLTCEKGKTYTVRMKVKANQTVEDPIFAITIKDIKGTEITGTNTEQESVKTGIINTGDIVTVDFTQEIDLQRTQFFLSLGCTQWQDNGDLKIFHRLYDVIEIPVTADKQTFGWFDMNSKVSIRREGA